MRTLAMLVVLTAFARIASADPVADHLTCYRVRDPERRVGYTADLDGLSVARGCMIRLPAKLTCVPTVKANVSPTPPGGGPSGEPNGFNCYVVKCPKAELPAIATVDQFGSRTVAPTKASLLCAPFGPPTTTSTTTETTTTTVALTCVGGMIGCQQPCGNGCTCMGPGTNPFCSGVHCGSFDQACVNTSVGPGAPCSFDDDCPAGQACAGVPTICAGGPFGPGACFPVCPE